MASCVVFEFNHMGTCIFPDVLLGAQFQFCFVGSGDCVFKCVFAQFVLFVGLNSCIFGSGL